MGIFAGAALLGAALGILYDINVCLPGRKAGGLRRGLLDGLFCFLCGVGVLWFLLQIAGGIFRGYVVLGMALGGLCHRLCLSRLLRPCLRVVFNALSSCRKAAGKGILWMFSFPRGN